MVNTEDRSPFPHNSDILRRSGKNPAEPVCFIIDFEPRLGYHLKGLPDAFPDEFTDWLNQNKSAM